MRLLGIWLLVQRCLCRQLNRRSVGVFATEHVRFRVHRLGLGRIGRRSYLVIANCLRLRSIL